MLSLAALKKDFIKRLEGISSTRRPYEVFHDWLEMAAISFHQLPYHAGDFPQDEIFAAYEDKYRAVERHYTLAERSEMAKLHGLTMLAHQQHFGDFLGEIYQECGFTNERAGQFFTPYHLSTFMAVAQLADAPAFVREKGMVTIQDPACGAGGMLIAAAAELYQQQVDPRACAQFEAIDIDRDCFNMAYIQLAALDLQAVVRHGNTLSGEMWESRPTPQLRYFMEWLEARREETKWVERLQLLRDCMSGMTTVDETESEPQPSPQQPSIAGVTAFPSGTQPPSPDAKKRQPKADVVIDRAEYAQQLNLFDGFTPTNE